MFNMEEEKAFDRILKLKKAENIALKKKPRRRRGFFAGARTGA